MAAELSRRRFLLGAGAAVATGVAMAPAGCSRAAAPDGSVRFGVTAEQGAAYDDIVGFWQEADSLGFDTAFVCDHFMAPFPGAPANERCFESWTLLSGLAAKTERIRLGVLVTGNTYRQPAILAKMAATLDHVSHGRLILGMGAGWLEREHLAYGIPFYTPPVRARQLTEAVRVVEQLFTQERATFTGKFYTLKDAPCEPKPLQKPHPPILIGGVGPKVVQPLAARHAQIWHSGVAGEDVAQVKRLYDSFDQVCARVGRDPREVEKAMSVDPKLGQSPSPALRAGLQALIAVGVRHFVFFPPPGNDRGFLRRLAKEVIPAFRQ